MKLISGRFTATRWQRLLPFMPGLMRSTDGRLCGASCNFFRCGYYVGWWPY